MFFIVLLFLIVMIVLLFLMFLNCGACVNCVVCVVVMCLLEIVCCVSFFRVWFPHVCFVSVRVCFRHGSVRNLSFCVGFCVCSFT